MCDVGDCRMFFDPVIWATPSVFQWRKMPPQPKAQRRLPWKKPNSSRKMGSCRIMGPERPSPVRVLMCRLLRLGANLGLSILRLAHQSPSTLANSPTMTNSLSPLTSRSQSKSMSISPVRGRGKPKPSSRSPSRSPSPRSPAGGGGVSSPSQSPARRKTSVSPVVESRKSPSRSPVKSGSRAQGRSVPSRRSISRSPRRAPRRSPSRSPVKATTRRTISKSPAGPRTRRSISRSPARRAASPPPSHRRSLSRSASPNGSPRRVRRGRGFSQRYAYARRYRTPSPDRSPVRPHRYGGRHDRDRWRCSSLDPFPSSKPSSFLFTDRILRTDTRATEVIPSARPPGITTGAPRGIYPVDPFLRLNLFNNSTWVFVILADVWFFPRFFFFFLWLEGGTGGAAAAARRGARWGTAAGEPRAAADTAAAPSAASRPRRRGPGAAPRTPPAPRGAAAASRGAGAGARPARGPAPHRRPPPSAPPSRGLPPPAAAAPPARASSPTATAPRTRPGELRERERDESSRQPDSASIVGFCPLPFLLPPRPLVKPSAPLTIASDFNGPLLPLSPPGPHGPTVRPTTIDGPFNPSDCQARPIPQIRTLFRRIPGGRRRRLLYRWRVNAQLARVYGPRGGPHVPVGVLGRRRDRSTVALVVRSRRKARRAARGGWEGATWDLRGRRRCGGGCRASSRSSPRPGDRGSGMAAGSRALLEFCGTGLLPPCRPLANPPPSRRVRLFSPPGSVRSISSASSHTVSQLAFAIDLLLRLRVWPSGDSSAVCVDKTGILTQKRVEDVLPIATGHEREEIEAELEVRVFAPMVFHFRLLNPLGFPFKVSLFFREGRGSTWTLQSVRLARRWAN